MLLFLKGQTITGYLLTLILPGSCRPGHSCTALLVPRGMCCGNGWAISAECWRVVGAKIRGVLGRNTPCFLATAVCRPCEFLGTGLFQRQPHLGTGMVVQEGESLDGMVGFAPVGTRQQQSLPAAGQREAGNARAECFLNCCALLGQKQDPGSLIPTL